MRSIAWAVGLLFLGTPALRAAEGKTVRVHVFGRAAEAVAKAEKKAREKEADAERKRAERARKDLEKALQAKHGKRIDQWPEEARRESEAAWRTELRAALAHSETKLEENDLVDSASDLAKALADEVKKSPRVALSDSADAADLTVEVVSRAARSSFPAAAWLLYLKVTPVRWPGAAAFAGTPFEQVKTRQEYLGQILANQNLRGAVATVHAYTEAEPYWIVQVVQQGTSWKHVAWTAAEVLAAFSSDLAEVESGPAT